MAEPGFELSEYWPSKTVVSDAKSITAKSYKSFTLAMSRKHAK
jgi:hypothetical protein